MVVKCPKCHAPDINLELRAFDLYEDGYAKVTCKCKKCGTYVGVQLEAKAIFELHND